MGRGSRLVWGRRSSSSLSRLGGRSSVGGSGGFVKPKPTVFKPNQFGQTQYSSFSKPSRPIGSYAEADGKKYGYRTAGHGTNWGTSFSGGTGVYNKNKKKALGLGVAAGFVGGAALGMAGTMATYNVYHRYPWISCVLSSYINWIRYHEFQRMMYMNNPLQYGSTWDENYFSNYYSRYLHG